MSAADTFLDRLRWGLTGLLCFALLTSWVPQRWAVSLSQAGAFFLVAAWVAGRRVYHLPAHLTALLAPPAGAVLLGLVQLAAGKTVYRWETEAAVLNWTVNLAVLFLALQVFADPAARPKFLRFLLWFGFALSLLATLQRYTAGGKIFWLFESGYEEGQMGPFVYENQYAGFLEVIIPIALLAALETMRPRFLLVTAVMTASVVAAGSMAGAALVAAEILLVFLLAWRARLVGTRRLAAVLPAAALLILLFGSVVGWDPLLNKARRTDPYRARGELLLSSLEMHHDRPWMGFGLGTWSTAYPAYARFDDGLFDNQAHNDWVQWLVEGGIPLLLLMAWMAAMLARPAFGSVWGIGLLAVLAHCLLDYHFQQRPAFGYLFFALAAVVRPRGLRTGRAAPTATAAGCRSPT